MLSGKDQQARKQKASRNKPSPILEWRIEDGSGDDSIPKALPPAPNRWQPTLAALFLALGALFLGLYYLKPAPPLPPVGEVIANEARALAEGDLHEFMAVQDSADHTWQAQQLKLINDSEWRTDTDSVPYFRVIHEGTLPAGQVWADVSQFRGGRFFRQLRFYRLHDDRWVRIDPRSVLPDLTVDHGDTSHFDLVFYDVERQLAELVGEHFERLYQRACVDLGCPTGLSGGFPREMTITLAFYADVVSPRFTYEDHTFALSSPGLHGLYFGDLQSTQLEDGDYPDEIAYQVLPGIIARIASGGPERWERTLKGDLLVGNIGQWEALRLQSQAVAPSSQMIKGLRGSLGFWSLTQVWEAQPPYTTPDLDLLVAQAWALIAYVDERYGPEGIRQLLGAVSTAESLPDAIQNGLGVDYGEFRQQWLEWLADYPIS